MGFSNINVKLIWKHIYDVTIWMIRNNIYNFFRLMDVFPDKKWTVHHIMRYAHNVLYPLFCQGIPPFTEKNYSHLLIIYIFFCREEADLISKYLSIACYIRKRCNTLSSKWTNRYIQFPQLKQDIGKLYFIHLYWRNRAVRHEKKARIPKWKKILPTVGLDPTTFVGSL